MKKTVKITDIDCANCAAKIERNVQKIDGVQSAVLNFMAERLVFECDEARYDEIAEEIKKIAKRVEPDCKIIGL